MALAQIAILMSLCHYLQCDRGLRQFSGACWSIVRLIGGAGAGEAEPVGSKA